jgi:hypothetical protein
MLQLLLEEQLSKAFTTYGRLLEHWARGTLTELQLRFDASADAYRAQVASLMSSGSAATGEQQGILDDLVRLREVG